MDYLLYNPFPKWIIYYIIHFQNGCLLNNPFPKWIVYYIIHFQNGLFII